MWKYRFLLIASVICIIASSCNKKKETEPTPIVVMPPSNDVAVAHDWVKMTLKVILKADRNTPTYCSRSLGYLGLAMYESVVPAHPTKGSVSNKLNGLTSMPVIDKSKAFKPELALNAAQSILLKKYYGYVSVNKNASIDSLELIIKNKYSVGLSQEEVDYSIQFGKDVADTIYNWSTTDGGHEGYTKNFDPSYEMPNVSGKWEPALGNSQSPSLIPLHPHWGNNRRFVSQNDQLSLPVATTYSEDPTSLYYQQFYELYLKDGNLTEEEKEIALWWGDDPKDSYSPAGHSYNIALIVATKSNADLYKTVESFARLGMALSDAFVNCWEVKYIYVRERPSSFVHRHFSTSWKSFWPEPPFPSYISGHSTQGMAAAVVLEDMYGTSFSFTDTTNAFRPKDVYRNVEYKSRSYTSFRAFADECAISRFYGGIHIKFDNEQGAIVGEDVADNINAIFK